MVKKFRRWLKRSEEEGQGLTEYGLVLGLIAVVCIGALSGAGQGVNGLLNKVGASLSSIS